MRLAPRLLLAALVAGGLLALPGAASAASHTVWLCRPGMRANPCEPGLATTRFTPAGKRLGVERIPEPRHPRIDCFYVYPTVSDQKTPEATLRIDPEERSIARFQAAYYSQECRVFAPMYRQITLAGLLAPGSVTPQMQRTAYDDVRDAWREYLRRDNHGRGVVLISHSQGTFVLRQLVAKEIDRRPSVRRRLVSAILLGGNVTVKAGSDVGGDFRHVPACRSPHQVGCVIAFSTFNQPVPPGSLFGRALAPGQEVLCTNPAALRGGTGRLDPVFPSVPFAPGSTIGAVTKIATSKAPRAHTPWIAIPGAYRARCSSANGAHVLEIRPSSGPLGLKPSPDPTWGLHLVDANIALGNLVDVVRRQAAVYARGGSA